MIFFYHKQQLICICLCFGSNRENIFLEENGFHEDIIRYIVNELCSVQFILDSATEKQIEKSIF